MSRRKLRWLGIGNADRLFYRIACGCGYTGSPRSIQEWGPDMDHLVTGECPECHSTHSATPNEERE